MGPKYWGKMLLGWWSLGHNALEQVVIGARGSGAECSWAGGHWGLISGARCSGAKAGMGNIKRHQKFFLDVEYLSEYTRISF